jgi:hypothetical protein
MQMLCWLVREKRPRRMLDLQCGLGGTSVLLAQVSGEYTDVEVRGLVHSLCVCKDGVSGGLDPKTAIV